MNTINGRTPEEIKRGLEHCCKCEGCFECRYYDLCMNADEGMPILDDVRSLIQQLERERDELLQKNQQLERERDAAVEILHDFKMCAGCNHKGCADCRWFDDMTMKNKDLHDNWQWRGVQEVEL